MKIKSQYTFQDTLSRIHSHLEEKGVKVFATIDHQAAARSAGLEMLATTVLIFGNPKAGTPLMIAAPDFSLELPLRVLIREDSDNGAVWVTMNAAATLEGKHCLPLGMTDKLVPAEHLIAAALGASWLPDQ